MHALVRYSEIGTKSNYVKNKMEKVLRQRIVDRLEHEGIDYDKVNILEGRILVQETSEEAAEAISTVPGVASVSPARKTEADIESIKEVVRDLQIGETFGIEPNRAGEHSFSSQDIAREIGSFVEKEHGSSVDLDNPETWLGIDIRYNDVYVFTERYEGTKGYPVGTEDTLAALISGGIDSPVAAYEVMKRGCDVIPIYFYNKPIAAEDHLMRFRASAKKLKKFHPAKKWEAYIVDMEEVNQELLEIERGRMVLHRKIMFQVAEKIAEKEGLKGLVTGESIGQKSSQTPSNLEFTSASTEKPIHRPLLSWNKSRITEEAREIDTFEEASIDSACSTMAPENPATSMKRGELEKLEEEVRIDELVEKAFENAEKTEL